MRESDIELSVVAWAENNGWLARKIAYVGRRGCPDHLFVGHGHKVFVEFKKPNGCLDIHQERERRRWADHGGVFYVIDSIEAGIALLEARMK